MHGQGTYKFTSGNEYCGEWASGVMNGFGKMLYADGSSYEGTWLNNLMDGDGVYLDADKITWSGIFVEGQFDSKIQKKLQAEKVIKDKILAFANKAISFFGSFGEAFAKSDKKTFKDNLSPFLGSNETCNDYVNLDAFPKFEDRPADKWNELIKGVLEDPNHVFKALSVKHDSELIESEKILVDQLKSKPGGQIVEVRGTAGDKKVSMSLLELPSENWVVLFFSEA
jgi:hypothetical protein